MSSQVKLRLIKNSVPTGRPTLTLLMLHSAPIEIQFGALFAPHSDPFERSDIHFISNIRPYRHHVSACSG